jgi:hypothetical protein
MVSLRAPQNTGKFLSSCIHLEDTVLTKAVRPELHKSNIHGRLAVSKPLISDSTRDCSKLARVHSKKDSGCIEEICPVSIVFPLFCPTPVFALRLLWIKFSYTYIYKFVDHAISPGINRPGREADHTSNQCRGQENVDLYIHSPIRLHGVVLN